MWDIMLQQGNSQAAGEEGIALPYPLFVTVALCPCCIHIFCCIPNSLLRPYTSDAALCPAISLFLDSSFVPLPSPASQPASQQPCNQVASHLAQAANSRLCLHKRGGELYAGQCDYCLAAGLEARVPYCLGDVPLAAD